MKKKLKYVCTQCRAIYEAESGAVPYIVSWSDGHFCAPKLIGEEEVKKLSNKTKNLAKDELWTTYYN